MVSFGGGALVNAGEFPAVLVSRKEAVADPARAITENDPAAPLAVKVGAVATPDGLVSTWVLMPLPAELPDAPADRAGEGDGAAGIGLLAPRRTIALNAVA